jgi:hypothetical protein
MWVFVTKRHIGFLFFFFRFPAVTLEVGRAEVVMPDALRFCFEICARDTLVATGRHLEADMLARGLVALNAEPNSVVMIENVGTLLL